MWIIGGEVICISRSQVQNFAIPFDEMDMTFDDEPILALGVLMHLELRSLCKVKIAQHRVFIV